MIGRGKNLATYLGYNSKKQFDRLKFGLKKRLKRVKPVEILPYRGYGTTQKFYLKGRVLEDEGLAPARANDTVWQNLWAMYKRFESDEIPHVRLQARFQEVSQELVTDEEGFFSLELDPTQPLSPDQLWHKVELKLLDKVVPDQGVVETTGQVLVPPAQCEFGVISDIDDTIIKTQATSLVGMARITFFNNAKTRLPFKGVAGFYRALSRGTGQGNAYNPIFYVSGSPWNLYDLLLEFMKIQQIPIGPLFLRDFGMSVDRFLKISTKRHKLNQIEQILNIYPDLPFILIGDSGEKDPEIYRQVVKDFPGRIQAIYIRDVGLDGRDEAVKVIIDELGREEVEMLLVPDTEVAAAHAVEQGFISQNSLPDVHTEKIKDEQAPGELEQLLKQF